MQITHTQKEFVKSLKQKNKNKRIISWFACSKRYIIVSRCVWELLKYVSWNIWAWSCKFYLAPRLTWQAAIEKTKVNLDLLTDTDMLLMVKKVLEKEHLTLFIDMCKS